MMTLSIKLKAPNMLQQRFFETFVNAIANQFDGYKLANNGFIGILAKNYATYDKHYFAQDRGTALQ